MKEITIPVEHSIEESTETFGIVNTLSTWQEIIGSKDPSYNKRGISFTDITRLERDVDGEFYLSDVLTGYMTHPVALYNGMTITAQYKLVPDIIEFKKKIAESPGKYFLYDLKFESVFPRYTSIDDKTWTPERHDPIVNTSRGWFIRYGVLLDQE